jgi:hypothetical protein
MSGTDDRSPGSIEDLALSWGLSPERARKVAATAVALAAGSYPDLVNDDLPQRRGTAPRLPAQREASAADRIDAEATAPEPDAELTQ